MKNIKIFTVSLLLAFSAILSVSAQEYTKYTGALLWKISGNGLEKPSYILGTHHLKDVSFVDQIYGLKDVIDETQQVVGELIMSDQAAMQAKMTLAAVMPEGETYEKMLSKDEYNDLQTGLKDIMGVGLENMGQFKPGLISSVASVMLYSKIYPDYNMMSHEPIDGYVQRIAKEQSKPVLGLETIDDQIAVLFDAEPLKDQAISLACFMKHRNIAASQLQQLDGLYEKGDVNGIYDLSFNNPNDPCPTSQVQKHALGKARNDKWLLQLPEMMQTASSLVAVGVLHLAGEEGLLFQLAEKGYKVEAVKAQ